MGLIHVYTGDGKGKTTASLGLASRFMGQGGYVVLTQFLKGSDSGEITYFKEDDRIRMIRLEKDYGFTFSMSEETKEIVKKEHRKMLNEALAIMTSDFAGKNSMLILDECAGAVTTGLLEKDAIIRLMELSKGHFELVLTGRDFPEDMISLADYVSEVKSIKHPMDLGVSARKGIEF